VSAYSLGIITPQRRLGRLEPLDAVLEHGERAEVLLPVGEHER
jgi:hypothetical protein